MKHIIEETISEILKKKGNIQLFYSAIYQKVKLIDLCEYDNYCFAVNSDVTYNVNNVNFPKITSDKLFDGISNVKYKITLSTIEDFNKQN